jgi:hypothetical protein
VRASLWSALTGLRVACRGRPAGSCLPAAVHGIQSLWRCCMGTGWRRNPGAYSKHLHALCRCWRQCSVCWASWLLSSSRSWLAAHVSGLLTGHRLHAGRDISGVRCEAPVRGAGAGGLRVRQAAPHRTCPLAVRGLPGFRRVRSTRQARPAAGHTRPLPLPLSPPRSCRRSAGHLPPRPPPPPPPAAAWQRLCRRRRTGTGSGSRPPRQPQRPRTRRTTVAMMMAAGGAPLRGPQRGPD